MAGTLAASFFSLIIPGVDVLRAAQGGAGGASAVVIPGRPQAEPGSQEDVIRFATHLAWRPSPWVPGSSLRSTPNDHGVMAAMSFTALKPTLIGPGALHHLHSGRGLKRPVARG